MALRFIQHSALGLEAHKASLPLLTGLYLDLQAKGAPFPPVEDAEVCVYVFMYARLRVEEGAWPPFLQSSSRRSSPDSHVDPLLTN